MVLLTTESGNHEVEFELRLRESLWTEFFGILGDETSVQEIGNTRWLKTTPRRAYH